jgi:hypothetical protein
VYEVSAGRAVLLDAAGSELITLNPVGTLVWNALDGERDATAVAIDLHHRFGEVALDELTTDVGAFLAELAELGLVVGVDASG